MTDDVLHLVQILVPVQTFFLKPFLFFGFFHCFFVRLFLDLVHYFLALGAIQEPFAGEALSDLLERCGDPHLVVKVLFLLLLVRFIDLTLQIALQGVPNQSLCLRGSFLHDSVLLDVLFQFEELFTLRPLCFLQVFFVAFESFLHGVEAGVRWWAPRLLIATGVEEKRVSRQLWPLECGG